MKRKLRIVWLGIIFLSFAVGAQAAPVNWDVGSLGISANYVIPQGGNAATFIYYPPYYESDQSSGGNQSSSTLSIPAVSVTSSDFGPNPGEIAFYAMGGGGIHADGVVNQAVAQITRTGMNDNQYINRGHQLINSNIQRSFSADPGAAVSVSADITGIIDWVETNWDWDLPGGVVSPSPIYAGYQISALVHLQPMSLSGGGVTADIPADIHLDADNLSGSISFIADTNPDIFYRLVASIAIETVVQNWDASYGPNYALPDVGSLGIQGDPLLMTTTVEQASVPIPGAFVLLLSGCLSLVALRKRRCS